ncbi:MAG: nitroreductase family protein [archaeon]
MKLKDAVENRCDVKRFDLGKPDWRAIVRAIDFARFGTSAGNHFAVRFILVSDADVIGKLAQASQQPFIGKAKYVVVVVSDPSSLIRSYEDRATKYCELQAGVAIQNFLLGLEEEKLVTSWVWYYEDEQVKRILNIPGTVSVQGIFPVGKVTKITGKEKRDVKLENILFFGKYGEKKMTPRVVVGREAS